MAYYVKGDWSIVYDKAIRDDGSLFFPKRLTKEFLDEQRRVLGSYIFFNQYLNEIIPSDAQEFKSEWLRYYETVPTFKNTFAFIDPAISLSDDADYTALVVVHVSEANDWYVEVAKRFKITATEIIELIFEVYNLYKPQSIGVETVAFQKALIHFLSDEMRKRNISLPVAGISRGPDRTKEMRIRSLIPRFEWNRVYLKSGLIDFEDEYCKFPKSQHDDLLDALASIEEIAHPPVKKKEPVRVPHPGSKEYESEFIRRLAKKAGRQTP